MKRLFLDTNVLLDIILKRDPFYASAARLWLKVEAREVEGMVSLLSLGTIFYLVRKRTDAHAAREAIRTICRVLRVVDSPGRAANAALESRMSDFEDALQYSVASLSGADCLVTRNASDFPRHGNVAVLTPDEFLDSCKS